MTPSDAADQIIVLAGMTSLILDDDGNFTFNIDHDVPVEVQEYADSIALRCRLPDVAVTGPDLMRGLLEANLFGTGSGHGRLALENTTALLLDRFDPGPLDAAALEERLGEFLVFAAYWLTDGVADLARLDAKDRASRQAALATSQETVIRV
ncbi:type III secretion system chaperone [Pseudooceanicola aestuarii]|uniref:type III secretion system chaperone n=1 Tax=Pseudooceanicola aestuarii TaxID=2697319 RepID=UPI0013D381CB|nr:type III secretion system chaperone [Pseudooceanicola aestuarii]